jgi:O-antigen ligase
MSSRSAAEIAPGGRVHGPIGAVPTDGIRTLAVAALAAFVVANQLDAVANQVSDRVHFSLVQVSVAAPAIGALLVVANGTSRNLPAIARTMAAFLFWAVFCFTLSLHPAAGARYLGKLATAIGPALCVIAIVDRPLHVRVLIWSAILASAASAAIVLIEHHTHTRLVATSLAATTADFDGVARSSGGSDQNATTAAQMLMVGFVLAAAWLASGERRWRIVLIAIAALGAVALMLMSARSAVIGAGAAAMLILWSFRRSHLFPLVLLAAVTGGAALIVFAPPTLLLRFHAIEDFGQDQTLVRRITYLKIGFDLLRQSPVWGVGPGNFPLYYVSDAYRWMPGRELIPRELHNTYLDVATELGTIGLILFAIVIGQALRGAWRGTQGGDAHARASFAVGMALVALLVGCVFMPHKDMRYLWLLLALAERCGAIRARMETSP